MNNKQRVSKSAKSINLKANSDREFLLIHGYTGSPGDFRDLPQILHKKFKANVKVIRLHGHGTRIEDLNELKLEHFIEQMEKELQKDIKKGKRIVVGGYSFGAQLALYFATKYDLEGIFAIAIPYHFKFPFGIKGFKYLRHVKKYWKKRLSAKEKEQRRGCFNYDAMPGYALTMCKNLNRMIKKRLEKVTCPFLCIHSKRDHISKVSGIEEIERKIKSKTKRTMTFKDGTHNLSYSFYKKKTEEEIIKFFQKNAFKSY